LASSPAFAQDATWQATPTITNPDGNFDFNTNANWNPTTAPGSLTQTGTATFGASNGTSISFSAGQTTLSGFTFTAGASNYTFFTNVLIFNGVGLVVNGGGAAFSNGGNVLFLNASSASSATFTNSSGNTEFNNTSTAGSAIITNNSLGGAQFSNASTAGSATITNNNNGNTQFFDTSTAASAALTNNVGGVTNFGQFGGTDTSTAASATIMNNGGKTQFFASTTAGSAAITNSSGGGTSFTNTSTAGSATITNNGGTTEFLASTTAGSATITNNSGGFVNFGRSGGFETSTAGNATITNNSGGTTQFFLGTTAGNATITNNSGTTQFFAITTAGNATITNSNSGTTNFFETSSAGNAAITNNGGGLTFFGQSGGTDTSSAGSATITNNGAGRTFFFAGTTAGSAAITNNGSLAGAAFTFFNDTSTAGNATITNNGDSQTVFSASSTAGSATITNNSNGFTNFGQSGGIDTSTAGTATISNNSGGGTSFSANTTAGSATITNNNFGSTQFFDTSSAGNATITNNGGGATQFGSPGGTDTASAGNAVITNNSGGMTTFNANTTAGSATIANNGSSLQFFDTSTAGNAAITNNAITNNSGGSTSFFASTTAGNAAITNNGGGTLFADMSTAGNATITNNSGTVAFFGQSDGGTATLINGAAGVIDFSGSTGPNNDNQLNVGSLQGSGTFIVGPQQRVNVSGCLAFTSGALYVVQVQGMSASQIAVAGTATLAGNVEVDVVSRLTQKTTYTILTSSGLNNTTFGSVTLESANNFARDPVLSFTGNNVLLTLQPGLLSPTLPNNASANQVKVAGAIDNALLAGNNLSNAFSAVFNLSGNGLLNGLTQISGETATGSQQTTFNAMGLFMGLLTDPFMNRGGGLGGSSLSSGYAEEDGQASAYAATKPSDALAMFTKAPSHPSPASGGGSGRGFEPRWSVWAAGFGGSQSTSGNAALGSNNTTSNIAATAVGADYLFSPNTIAGFALAGGGTSFSIANGGTGRSDLFQAGAYLRHTSGAAYITGALAHGWQDITTNRTLMVGGLDQLRAEFNANAWSGRLEGGYRFVTPALGGLGITPYAAAQFVTFDLPQYAEQAIVGLNTFALSYGARDVTDARSELGIRTDKSWATSEGILTLRGRLAWAHDYDPDRSIAATFQTLPAASFVVNGAAQASDSALTTAAVEMKWKNGWSVAATFEGEFSSVTNSYAGKGVVRYQW
jgi:uncharacterized protein with beta-barrel porin domain